MASKPAPAAAAPSPVTLRMQVYLYAQLATLALTAAAIPSVLIAPLAVAIPLALVAQLVVWALVAHATLTGLTLDASGLARLLANEAAHYLLFIGTFLVAVRTPMLMALVPLAIYAFFHAAPKLREYGLYADRIEALQARATEARAIAAQVELLMLPSLVVNALFNGGSLWSVLFYFQFLRLRYRAPNSVTAFMVQAWAAALDAKLGSYAVYQKLRGFVALMA